MLQNFRKMLSWLHKIQCRPDCSPAAALHCPLDAQGLPRGPSNITLCKTVCKTHPKECLQTCLHKGTQSNKDEYNKSYIKLPQTTKTNFWESAWHAGQCSRPSQWPSHLDFPRYNSVLSQAFSARWTLTVFSIILHVSQIILHSCFHINLMHSCFHINRMKHAKISVIQSVIPVQIIQTSKKVSKWSPGCVGKSQVQNLWLLAYDS